MMENMAFALGSLLKDAEEGGAPPFAIVMNKRSFEAFFLERSAYGEKIINAHRFKGYQIIIDESLDDYEILLPADH